MFELENFAFSWWKIDWCPLFVIVLLLWLRKIMAAGFWFLYTIIAFHFTKLYIPKKITAFLLRSVYALSYFMWKNWKLEWNRLMVKTSTWTCLGWPLKLLQDRFICNSLHWPILVSNILELEWQLKWLNVTSFSHFAVPQTAI